MKQADFNTVLTDVIAAIRSTIAEDWIADYPIDADTRLGDDLEIESMEFVRVIDELSRRFGTGIELVRWLADRDLDELINLTPGDLATHITSRKLRA